MWVGVLARRAKILPHPLCNSSVDFHQAGFNWSEAGYLCRTDVLDTDPSTLPLTTKWSVDVHLIAALPAP